MNTCSPAAECAISYLMFRWPASVWSFPRLESSACCPRAPRKRTCLGISVLLYFQIAWHFPMVLNYCPPLISNSFNFEFLKSGMALRLMLSIIFAETIFFVKTIFIKTIFSTAWIISKLLVHGGLMLSYLICLSPIYPYCKIRRWWIIIPCCYLTNQLLFELNEY